MMHRRSVLVLGGASCLLGLLKELAGQEKQPPAVGPFPIPDDAVVVAKVGEVAITSGEVQYTILRMGLPAASSLTDASWKQGLAHATGRELALLQLSAMEQIASASDVDEALGREKRRLKEQGETFTSFLKKNKLNDESHRRIVTWDISWQRYLEAKRTDKAFQVYFEKNRKDFDGTQLRLSQIFWKRKEDAGEEGVKALLSEATKVKKEIQSGMLKFAEGAKKYSQSPSGQEGGDIGWIERHQPMPEEISATAFKLATGEISEPIVTPLGVHLVTVTEQKPGKKTWSDCREELHAAVTAYLLRYLREQGLKRAEERGIKLEVIPAEKLQAAAKK